MLRDLVGLENLPVLMLPWIVVGEFNYFQDDSECTRGQPRPLIAIEDFNQCINNCGLLDLKFSKGRMS